jgi:serine/threonine protein kinase
MIGKTLAHYEITALLGAGGMGQVYAARDTKLARDVALKLLPPELSGNDERRARFEREARTLAQLQHPHIASIYGFEEVGEHRFLVMELAEGQDLSVRLAAGPLPLGDALEIARQIALGLEAAHEKGIIHRDLKPANVMIGSDGQVKILDFGLARAYEENPQAQPLAHSPTITAAMTQAGVILGTAAYMSPEQARGRAVDQRTDVWAFGAVLFEMITGRQVFSGEVVSDILARILERDPAWEELPQRIHPSVTRLLERCLTKDPKERLHSAADARIEIQDALADPSGQDVAQHAEPRAEQAIHPLRRALPWVLCAVLATWVVFSLLPSPAPDNPMVQFNIAAPADHRISEFSMAPDGSAVVFATHSRAGARSLWLREIDSTELRQLPGTEAAMFPFWSPGSDAIAFFADGKLRRLDLASGTLQTVADAPNGRGGDWHEDGTILFTPEGEDVLYTVAASGGTPSVVTQLSNGEVSHRFPHFLPSGRRFVFSAHGQDSVEKRRYLASFASDERQRLPDGMSEAYAPPGYLLFIRELTLMAQSFDESTGQLVGEPTPLASGISDVFPRTARSAYSVSDNGVLAYLETKPIESHFRMVDRAGRTLETLAPAGQYSWPAASRDGKSIAFSRLGSVWLLNLERGASTRLLEAPGGVSLAPGWSRDETGILACSVNTIIRQSLAGGPLETIFVPADEEEAATLSAFKGVEESTDGSFLLFSAWDPVTDYDLWTLQLEGDSRPQRLSITPRVQDQARISPNMRWIAYASDESGRVEIYLRPTEPGEVKWLVSTAGGSTPMWHENGTELFYISATGELMAVSVAEGSSGPRAGLPVALFNAPTGVPQEDGTDSFPQPRLAGIVDGNFLFHVPAEELPPHVITVVLNWERMLVP